MAHQKEKLFVITRSDLPIGDQAVQCGHAVQAWDIDYKPKEVLTKVYLVVDNEEALKFLVTKLNLRWNNHVTFHEPDLKFSLTSIASTAAGRFFKGLKKLGE